ncbi:S-layer homology domain-containing protein [Patescibacteria group bacterium]|nr:S-layer homology domain-containing protein [Patescibacteria group bacterium]MBU1703082.1 S-layer homology domain-containing protein [Patescibacteria group bacterium]MBU1953682.1 S-layer homology domain-containing protein [Patescibacteria group bacterium]
MKKIAIITCTGLLFSGMAATALAFTDVDNTNENSVAINYLADSGIVKGYDDGTFRPQQLVNRAEALKIILEGKKVATQDAASSSDFSDVKPEDWFAKYVMAAKERGIVSGNPDGTFAPGRNVSRAEFVKMILNTNSFQPQKWEGAQLFPDVQKDAWFAPYMNYAGQAGLVEKDNDGNLKPGEELTRGQVAEIMYIMNVILNGSNTQFLITQAEKQMAQIDIYVGNNNPLAAKRSSELGVDMTQQAYKNMPQDAVVLGAAKLARAYDFLMNAYISGVQKKTEDAKSWADQAIAKATEAWEANNEVQSIARHIKDRANEIIAQLQG